MIESEEDLQTKCLLHLQAIHLAPTFADLYTSRAAAFLRRDWMGDAFAALADCEAAIALDPKPIKAYARRIYALITLKQLQVNISPESWAFSAWASLLLNLKSLWISHWIAISTSAFHDAKQFWAMQSLESNEILNGRQAEHFMKKQIDKISLTLLDILLMFGR